MKLDRIRYRASEVQLPTWGSLIRKLMRTFQKKRHKEMDVIRRENGRCSTLF
jgi:hypothetical protein